MVTLENQLNALNFSTQLEAVKNTLIDTRPNVTFWGTRIIEKVEVIGHVSTTSSVSLDEIAEKVARVARQRCDADDLSLQERIVGMDIVKQLRSYYQITDTSSKNLITRFLLWIREFTFGIPYFTDRFYFETQSEGFWAYSEQRFLREFGGSFDEMGQHPASRGSFRPPRRILAREESIRGLVGTP